MEHTWLINFLREHRCTYQVKDDVTWWTNKNGKTAYIKPTGVDEIQEDWVNYMLNQLEIPKETFLRERADYLKSIDSNLDFDALIEKSLKTPPITKRKDNEKPPQS